MSVERFSHDSWDCPPSKFCLCSILFGAGDVSDLNQFFAI
jgi:hypothetical protein